MATEPRYSPTEDFFHDKQFSNFLRKLRQDYQDCPGDLLLVFNGDVFDFLTVTRVPSADEAMSRGFSVLPSEREFGLNPTEDKSTYKLDVIAEGHPLFFQALADFVSDGFKVVIIPGNHDLELHYEAVKKRLISHLVSLQQDPDAAAIEARVVFEKWFYFEPGRVYIEHGNQYDSANSIRYPLRPILTRGRWWKAESERALDYPLGSIFVRFFYNRVRRLDPYMPRLLSFEQYLDFIRRYNLFDVWRVYRDHYPHFLSALSPDTTTGSSRSSDADDAKQTAAFEELKDEEEHGYLYEQLNGLKTPPAPASKPHVVKEMVSPVVRRAMRLSLFAFVAVVLWVGLLELIDMVPWFASALLMSLFAVATIGGLAWTWINLHRKLRRRSVGTMLVRYRKHAEKLAKMTEVPLVLMGHTHRVDYKVIDGGSAVYANSGTWTSVENPWKQIMRDARRLTFLYVKGKTVKLSRFNDDASRFDEVPLFYLEGEDPPDNLTLDKALIPEPRREHSWLPSSDVDMDDEQ